MPPPCIIPGGKLFKIHPSIKSIKVDSSYTVAQWPRGETNYSFPNQWGDFFLTFLDLFFQSIKRPYWFMLSSKNLKKPQTNFKHDISCNNCSCQNLHRRSSAPPRVAMNRVKVNKKVISFSKDVKASCSSHNLNHHAARSVELTTNLSIGLFCQSAYLYLSIYP